MKKIILLIFLIKLFIVSSIASAQDYDFKKLKTFSFYTTYDNVTSCQTYSYIHSSNKFRINKNNQGKVYGFGIGVNAFKLYEQH
jgi:hypothetical protein